MMKRGLSRLLPILILAIGLPLMIGASAIVPNHKIRTIVTLLAFIAYNVLSSRFLNLNRRLKIVWNVRKIWHLLPGFLIGAIPIGAAYICYFMQGSLPAFQGMTVLSAFLTLATVGWEELWFRGIPLELGAMKYTRFGALVLFAVVFALLHIMNPKISLIEDGLQLFIAGYALGACYFAFDSIWAPVGMHFANNSIQAFFGKSTEPRTIVYTGPLVVIAFILTFAIWRRERWR